MGFGIDNFGRQPFGAASFATGAFGGNGKAPTPWTPLDLGWPLLLWFDVDSGVVAPGGVVASWTDRKQGKVVSQATQGLMPTLVSGAFGAKRGLAFTGGQTIGNAGPSGIPTGWANTGCFAVYKPSNLASACTLSAQGPYGWGGNRFALQSRQAPLGDPMFSAYASDVFTGMEKTTDTKIAYAQVYNDTGIVFKNGTQVGPTQGGISCYIYPDKNQLYIGSNAGSEPMEGLIGDVVWTHALSDANRQKVEGYLAWKFGLVALLPSDHPYKSAAPVIEE